MIEFNVTGLKEIERRLSRLPGRAAQRALSAGVRSGAAVIARAAGQRVPVKEGKLKKSIKVRVKARTGWGTKIYTVSAGGDGVSHAHLVEFGTAPHVIRARKESALSFAGGEYSTVEHPGAAAKPFLRPAFDENIDKAIEAMKARIKVRIEAEASTL